MSPPIAVIPARYASTRFPGKPLTMISGKPMIQHVYERCTEASCFARVIVATDDQRIVDVVKGFRGDVQLTSPDCASGTDRVAEVARELRLDDGEVIVNVQGDEPSVHPRALLALAQSFIDGVVQMATLVRPLREDERGNPNVVKAVLDEHRFALYFSRADLPYARNVEADAKRWAHLGLYGYRVGTLHKLSRLAPTMLEKTESLEQLRALGNGIRILCRETNYEAHAVDAPSDVPLAEAALARLLSAR
ncbi:MAG: 3-deoxy-manno-octulosonate cytidylyltransferase [Archangium gephyra]|uniref:3-deoxy-manno-octulosonate cytidylyltransferase n=1 Tax=Archangium gephyra TaxID=48 RepID=A0A2W5TUH4_9BACT|nr:MAG: 3-deoxy-manno-octulosonate cytidylyltransferase [Archangium gephyra]